MLKTLLSRAEPSEAEQIMALVWPVTLTLLRDRDQQVRAVAEDAVIEFAPLLPAEFRDARLLPNLLALAGEDAEEQRMTAAKLLGEAACLVGQEAVQAVVCPQFVTLATDAMFRVRKATALYIGKVCRWASRDVAVATLLPVYLALAEDEIWGVRKACAESLADVAAALPQQVRGARLVPVFDKLATDVSRWVRNSAFQYLGPLIATLANDEITPKLLQYYSSMASGKGSTGGSDNEMPAFCAYNFPAVAMSAGRDKWKHLEEAYRELQKDIQWKVRRTLAYSVHEMALILGPALAQQALIPAVDAFLKDLDEVKIGVIQNLSRLLAGLDPAGRAHFVSLICSLEMESDNWRFRQLLATQLGELFELYEEDVIRKELYPIFIKLARDPVAEVRGCTAAQLQRVLQRLDALQVSWWGDVSEEVLDLADDRNYQYRLVFAGMAERLLEGDVPALLHTHFTTLFLPKLLELCDDHVPNIRARVAACLRRAAEKAPSLFIADAPRILAAADRLGRDRDVDVVRSAGVAVGLGVTTLALSGRPDPVPAH